MCGSRVVVHGLWQRSVISSHIRMSPPKEETLANVSQRLLLLLRFVGGFPIIWQRTGSANGRQTARVSAGYRLYTWLLCLAFMVMYMPISIGIFYQHFADGCNTNCLGKWIMFGTSFCFLLSSAIQKLNNSFRFKLLKISLENIIQTKNRLFVVGVRFKFCALLSFVVLVLMEMHLLFIVLVELNYELYSAIFIVFIDCDTQLLNSVMSQLIFVLMNNIANNIDYMVNSTIKCHKSNQTDIKKLDVAPAYHFRKEYTSKYSNNIDRTAKKNINLDLMSNDVKNELKSTQKVFNSLQSFFEFPVLVFFILATAQCIGLLLTLAGLTDAKDQYLQIMCYYLLMLSLQMWCILDSQNRYNKSVSQRERVQNIGQAYIG